MRPVDHLVAMLDHVNLLLGVHHDARMSVESVVDPKATSLAMGDAAGLFHISFGNCSKMDAPGEGR